MSKILYPKSKILYPKNSAYDDSYDDDDGNDSYDDDDTENYMSNILNANKNADNTEILKKKLLKYIDKNNREKNRSIDSSVIDYIDNNNSTSFKFNLENYRNDIEKIDIMGLTSPSLKDQIDTLNNQERNTYEKIINKYRLFSDFIDMVHDFKICNDFFFKLIGYNKAKFPDETLEEFQTLFINLCSDSNNIRVDKSYVIQYELFKDLIKKLKELNLNIPELPEYEVLLKDKDYNDYFKNKNEFFNWFRESGKGSPIGYKISANNYSVLDGCKQIPINMPTYYPKFWTQNVAGLFDVTVYPNSLNENGDKGAKFVVNYVDYVDEKRRVITVTYNIGSRATLDNVLRIKYNDKILNQRLLKKKKESLEVFTQNIITAAKRGKDDDDDDDEQCILENSTIEDSTITITNLKINGQEHILENLDKEMRELIMVFSECIKTLCDKLVIERVQNNCMSPSASNALQFEPKHLHALFTIDSYVPYVGILEYLAKKIDYCFPTFVKIKKGFKYLDMPTVGSDNKLLKEKLYYFKLLKKYFEINDDDHDDDSNMDLDNNNSLTIIQTNLKNTDDFFKENIFRKDILKTEDLWKYIQYEFIKNYSNIWIYKKSEFEKSKNTVKEINNLIKIKKKLLKEKKSSEADGINKDLITLLFKLPDVPNMALELSELIEESDEFIPLSLTENIKVIHDILTFEYLTGTTREITKKINEHSELYRQGHRFTNGEAIVTKMKKNIELFDLEKKIRSKNNNQLIDDTIKTLIEDQMSSQYIEFQMSSAYFGNKNINQIIDYNIKNLKLNFDINTYYDSIVLEYIKEYRKKLIYNPEEQILVIEVNNIISKLIQEDNNEKELNIIGFAFNVLKDFNNLKHNFYTFISKLNPIPKYDVDSKLVTVNLATNTDDKTIKNIVKFFNEEGDRKIKYISENATKKLIIPLSIELIINLTYASLLKVSEIDEREPNAKISDRIPLTEFSKRSKYDIQKLNNEIIEESYIALKRYCDGIEIFDFDTYSNVLFNSIEIEKDENKKNIEQQYNEWIEENRRNNSINKPIEKIIGYIGKNGGSKKSGSKRKPSKQTKKLHRNKHRNKHTQKTHSRKKRYSKKYRNKLK